MELEKTKLQFAEEAEAVREVLQQVQEALTKISEQLDTYQEKYGS